MIPQIKPKTEALTFLMCAIAAMMFVVIAIGASAPAAHAQTSMECGQ